MRAKHGLWFVMLAAACGASAPPAPGGPVGPVGEAARSEPTGAEEPGAEAPGSGTTGPTATAPAARPTGPRGPTPEATALLEAHNRYRADHCAPALTWSDKVAASAQRWADHLRDRGCAFGHSDTPYGENLAAGTTGTLGAEGAVTMWYQESATYPWRSPGFSMKTGHFTQVVWKASARLGCGKSTCNGMEIWVCQYDPPGNVEGSFDQQVLPKGCQ